MRMTASLAVLKHVWCNTLCRHRRRVTSQLVSTEGDFYAEYIVISKNKIEQSVAQLRAIKFLALTRHVFCAILAACSSQLFKVSTVLDLVICNQCGAKTTSYYDVCGYNQLLRLTGWPVNRRIVFKPLVGCVYFSCCEILCLQGSMTERLKFAARICNRERVTGNALSHFSFCQP